MTKNCGCVLIKFYFLFTVLLGVFGSEFVQVQHLSTWTTEYPLQSPDSYSPAPQGCSVKTGVLIARHGNRFPTKPTLESLDALSKKLKDAKPFPKYSWLKDWRNPVPETEAGLLVDRGQRVHYELAKRFQQNFPSLSNFSYSPELFPIRSSYVSRTALSAASFAYGLFEGRGALPKNYNPVYIQTGPEKKDLLLRFFDSCPKYQQKVMRSGAAQLEAKKWGEMVFPSVLREIEALVGVSNLTLDDALAMWLACELEVGVYNKHQGFCSLFDETRTQKMEYFEDLFHYWANFYGFDINWQMAAPLLQEVATALNSSVDGFSIPLRMYFAHAETIMPFIALLGLFEDSEKLLANSPREVVMNRKFRASLVSPFAANVIFVGYQCGSHNFKIKVMVNEKEMTLPGCSSLYCPLEEFQTLYKQKLNFDFHDLCDQTSNSSVGKGKQNLHMTFT